MRGIMDNKDAHLQGIMGLGYGWLNTAAGHWGGKMYV